MLWISQSASLLYNLLYLQGDMIRHGFFPRKAQLRVPAKSWWPNTKLRRSQWSKACLKTQVPLNGDETSAQKRSSNSEHWVSDGQWVRAKFFLRSAVFIDLVQNLHLTISVDTFEFECSKIFQVSNSINEHDPGWSRWVAVAEGFCFSS